MTAISNEHYSEHYVARYLCMQYILADAFRPNPSWGSQLKRIDAGELPPHTDAEIVDAAHRGTPDGFWLQMLTLRGEGEPRILFHKPVPVNSHGDVLTPFTALAESQACGTGHAQ